LFDGDAAVMSFCPETSPPPVLDDAAVAAAAWAGGESAVPAWTAEGQESRSYAAPGISLRL
jgi:hypothetical protein